MEELNNLFTNIANSIRSKLGTGDKIPANKLADEIDKIETVNGETLTVSPSTIDVTYVPSRECNAITKVNVKAVTCDIDENIIPENIRSGTTILGITGTLEPGTGEDIPINGTNAKVLASDDIQKGDLCSLLLNNGERGFVSVADFPLEIKDNTNGTLNVSSVVIGIIPAVLNDGEFIFVSNHATEPRVYPFIKTSTGYQQMTINGKYTYMYSTASGYVAYQPAINTIYDKDLDVIYSIGCIGDTDLSSAYYYKMSINRTNKTLTADIMWSTTDRGFAIINGYMHITPALKGHFFTNKTYATSNINLDSMIVSYKPSTGKWEYGVSTVKTDIIGSITNSQNASATVLDTVTISSTECIAAIKYYHTDYPSNSCWYIVKCNATNNALTFGTSIQLLKGNIYGTIVSTNNNFELLTSRINITRNGVVYAMDASTKIHKYVVNYTNMSYVEKTLTFADGLDINKITFFRATKDDDYLFVLSSDNSYSAAEKFRLYKYDSVTDTYIFVNCPSINSTPLAATQVPRNRSYNTNISNFCFDTNSGTTHLYTLNNIGTDGRDFDYSGSKNTDKKLGNFNGYGIATENIAKNAIGNCKVILTQ